MPKKWDKSLKTIDFNYLKSILNNSKLQVTNNAAYQVIWQLIRNAEQNKNVTEEQIHNLVEELNAISNTINNISTGLVNQDYLTHKNDFPALPKSRELIPGAGVTFDDTNPHQRIINTTGGGAGAAGILQAGIDDVGNDEVMLMPPGVAGSTGATGATGPQGPPGLALDGDDGTDGLSIPGVKGLDGATGAQGPAGPAIFLEQETLEADIPIPGAKGIDGAPGSPGITGPQGPIGIGLDGDTGDDGFSIPGTPGQAGNPGAIGPQGPIGLGLDGIDGEEYHIPGPVGPTGNTGASGLPGTSTPGMDGQDADEPIPLPGSIGATGATGTAGKDGIQPEVLISLIARLLRRIKFLEEGVGTDYKTDDLVNNTTPTDDELLSLEIDGLVPTQGFVLLTDSFGITIDGGGSVFATGFKGVRRMPYSGVISSIYIDCGDGLTGSIAIDIYKGTTPILTSANSIVGSNKPTINSSTSYFSTALAGIAFAAGDVFGFNVDSVSTFTRVTMTINIKYNQQLF